MTDHLKEVEQLADDCIRTAIELLPHYDETQDDADRTSLANHLLIHLRAIQQEVKMHREERSK